MRLKKNLSQMVESDYTPLSTTEEGALLGGFGTIVLHSVGDISGNNLLCKNPKCTNGECPNPNCTNAECPNPTCVNQCTINNCSCTPSPNPDETNANMTIGF